MDKDAMKEDSPSINEEDEIFKSLSHQIRRDIIKFLGNQKSSSFTEIKNKLGSIDSPSLSYHLKSLHYLLDQKNNQYHLTDVGNAALMLMDRIDQTGRLKRSKKKFVIANIVTILCWSVIMIFIPVVLGSDFDISKRIIIIVLLNVMGQLNFFIIFRLWNSSWNYPNNIKTK